MIELSAEGIYYKSSRITGIFKIKSSQLRPLT
ncbi:MAG: hypothetical protein H6Q73_2971 [Firmicutes bacterium]|nr:hypothetical protein [Bacillota bacterium]